VVPWPCAGRISLFLGCPLVFFTDLNFISIMSIALSKATGIKTVFCALNILKENGGSMARRDVLAEMERRLVFTDSEKFILEKSGWVRWHAPFHFYSLHLIKAGFLVKKKGIWYLTPEGEQALALGAEGLFDTANKAYRQWHQDNPKITEIEEGPATDAALVTLEAEPGTSLEEVESNARKGIEDHIARLNAYEFQDLCAALLRGMDYFTPFVAPKGKDGGIDIIAYRDPLGTSLPRIRVQVKHRENAASDPELHQLVGTLKGDGDVGIFISSGGFTSAARAVARNTHAHIELIDLGRFIELWQEFYLKLKDEDKQLLPLLSIYFLAPAE
jgi:restriction system protein